METLFQDFRHLVIRNDLDERIIIETRHEIRRKVLEIGSREEIIVDLFLRLVVKLRHRNDLIRQTAARPLDEVRDIIQIIIIGEIQLRLALRDRRRGKFVKDL